MATAVRLTADAAGIGEFGHAVVSQLAESSAVRRRTVPELAGSDADVLLLVLWRPSPAICEQLDELAFASGRPWLPIVAEHPHVLAGPWVQPPSGPCFRCYQAALGQAVPGAVTAYDVHSGHLTTQQVAGVHGCSRCDVPGELGRRDGRTLASFVAALIGQR